MYSWGSAHSFMYRLLVRIYFSICCCFSFIFVFFLQSLQSVVFKGAYLLEHPFLIVLISRFLMDIKAVLRMMWLLCWWRHCPRLHFDRLVQLILWWCYQAILAVFWHRHWYSTSVTGLLHSIEFNSFTS